MKAKIKLSLLSFVALIGLLILGIEGIYQLRTVNHGLETVYNDRVIPLEQLNPLNKVIYMTLFKS